MIEDYHSTPRDPGAASPADGSPDVPLHASVLVLNLTGTTTSATGTPNQPYLDRADVSPGRTSEYLVRVRATGRFTALPGRQKVLAGVGSR